GNTLNFSLSNPYIIGAAAACIVGWIYKNLLLTIVVSMAIFLGAVGLNRSINFF
ncbi:MAG: AzlD domain-containing protein, partial [Desulfamplus sp.]|nr:AzlD domain-containing protein [Desulfamplus sp.]